MLKRKNLKLSQAYRSKQIKKGSLGLPFFIYMHGII